MEYHMKTFGSRNLALSAVCLILSGWASYSIAEQLQSQPAAGKAGQQDKSFDGHIASCLILGNQNEVAAAKLAESKAETGEVRAFAKGIDEDHQRFIAQLEKFAVNHYRHREARDIGAVRDRGAVRERGAPAARGPVAANRNPAAEETREAGVKESGDHHAHMAKFMTIREEIADQCRASLTRELDSKQGKEFDECFMGMQIGYHMMLVDELTVLAKHASPELRTVLQKELATAQKHFDNAKQIMNDLRGEKPVRATATETESE
jgi:predicted outer membrane protein